MYGYDDYFDAQEKKKKIIKWAIIITAAVIVTFLLISTVICFIAHAPAYDKNLFVRNNNFDNIDITEYYPYLKG